MQTLAGANQNRFRYTAVEGRCDRTSCTKQTGSKTVVIVVDACLSG